MLRPVPTCHITQASRICGKYKIVSNISDIKSFCKEATGHHLVVGILGINKQPTRYLVVCSQSVKDLPWVSLLFFFKFILVIYRRRDMQQEQYCMWTTQHIFG